MVLFSHNCDAVLEYDMLVFGGRMLMPIIHTACLLLYVKDWVLKPYIHMYNEGNRQCFGSMWYLSHVPKCMYQCVAIVQSQFWSLGIVLAHVCLCVYQWIYWYFTILIVFSGIQCLQYLLCTAGFLSYGTPGQTGEGVEKQWNHVILVILRWMFGMWKHEMVLGCVIPSGKWYCVHRGRQEWWCVGSHSISQPPVFCTVLHELITHPKITQILSISWGFSSKVAFCTT